MILDHLSNIQKYVRCHPGFAQAFELLAQPHWAKQPAGRYEIIAQKLYISVDEARGRGRAGAVLEAHRAFVDIQVIVSGCEEIGWRDTASCKRMRGAFDPDRDMAFYDDEPHSWLVVPEGYFAIFFPTDAHAPLAGTGAVRKIVVKVAADW